MENEFKKMNDEELGEVAGGKNALSGSDHSRKATVRGLQTGFLALRKAPVYDDSNIIGHLYNGYKVRLGDKATTTSHDFNHNGATPYVWVYSYDLDKSGWVNASFIG